MARVVILQEYVPGYRVPFFSLLHRRAAERGIEIVVGHGDPHGEQAIRSDRAHLPFGVTIAQREFSLAGRRVVLRSTRSVRRGADLVILEQARRNLDAYALLLPRFARQRIALWGHGRDYTRAASGVDARIQAALTRRADWFFAYTRGGAQAVIAQGMDPERITVVQNAIDTSALRVDLQAAADTVAEFAARYDLRGETAIFLGALDPSKRLDMLMRSADLVSADRPDFRLLVVGGGVLAPDVRAWVESRPWAHYLGPQAGEDKARALAASQVIAMPGRVGLVAVDSFAAGVPIVTTAWQWHAPEFEYLVDGVNAVISADDDASFARSLARVLGDPPHLAAMAARGRSDGDTYTVETMVDNYLAGIESALARGARAAS